VANASLAARKRLGEVILVTTDDVLVEFLTALRKGPVLREKAVQVVRAILGNPNVKVIPHSRKSFLEGLDLYAQRQDKEYSLTDCISMNVMKSESIQESLTNDDHFEQEGFRVLIEKP
jgi:predicted nucleic acid-binding protein